MNRAAARRAWRIVDGLGLWLLVAWPAVCVVIAIMVWAYGG